MIFMAVFFFLIFYGLVGLMVNVAYLDERPYPEHSYWSKGEEVETQAEYQKRLTHYQNMLVARIILWPMVLLGYVWWLVSWPFKNQRWTSHVRPILINMLGIFKGRVQ
jgi:hypothetical protein